MNKINPWILAIRPKTLTASTVPVLMVSALAISNGHFNFYVFLSCLFSALFLQIGSNLVNDYFDFFKKADTETRLGPTRVTAAGIIKPKQVKLSFIITFILATLAGLPSIYIGGIEILYLGLICIIFAILYTAGPLPLAYLGLGEVFALIFFGPIPTGATYYIMANIINLESIMVGLIPGFFAMTMIAINNLRDLATDKIANKKTLAVLFGETFARYESALLLLLAPTLPTILLIILFQRYFLAPMILITILAIPTARKLLLAPISKEFNNYLAIAARINFISGITYVVLLFSLSSR